MVLDLLARRRASRRWLCATRGCRRSAWRSGSRRDDREPGIEQVVDVGRAKASASIAAQSMAACTDFAVVADARLPAARVAPRARGWPGATIAQPSMKICAPICSATVLPLVAIEPRGRRRDAALQVEPGGVLGGIADAAPPEDRALLDDVVEPGLADLLGASDPARCRSPRARGGR